MNLIIPDDFTLEEIKYVKNKIEIEIGKSNKLNELYFYAYHKNGFISIKGYNKREIDKVCKKYNISSLELFLNELRKDSINTN